MEAQKARRAEVWLLYDGADISKDIAPYLTAFSYTDNEGGKADDIEITLEDREGNWRDPWFPSKGATLTANIVLHNWTVPNMSERLPCGTFEIDEIECSGPPTQVKIKGVSTAASKSMRQEAKTRGWENVPLSAIAGDIASDNGLSLFWDSKTDPLFERRGQVETSDLEFLQNLCEKYGINVKVSENQLICFSEEEYEEKPAIGTLSMGDQRIKSYRFQKKKRGTHKSAKVTYHDAIDDEDFEGYAEALEEDGAGGSINDQIDDFVKELGEPLVVNQRAESQADADLLAGKALHESNKKESTTSITMIGDVRFVAGVNVQLSGWGKFDGKYFIEKATHAIDGGGYGTALELRLCGEKPKTPSLNSGFDVYGGSRDEKEGSDITGDIPKDDSDSPNNSVKVNARDRNVDIYGNTQYKNTEGGKRSDYFIR